MKQSLKKARGKRQEVVLKAEIRLRSAAIFFIIFRDFCLSLAEWRAGHFGAEQAGSSSGNNGGQNYLFDSFSFHTPPSFHEVTALPHGTLG